MPRGQRLAASCGEPVAKDREEGVRRRDRPASLFGDRQHEREGIVGAVSEFANEKALTFLSQLPRMNIAEGHRQPTIGSGVNVHFTQRLVTPDTASAALAGA
jgi:hypothetical protein